MLYYSKHVKAKSVKCRHHLRPELSAWRSVFSCAVFWQIKLSAVENFVSFPFCSKNIILFM